ncbi:hypothetical protein [Methylobacterium sp. J-070]|uniref:hypothetical protein n=1 Tax=Methylobacterium sp. J-070 TaxID=2836650 RepID=UPI001FB9B8AA|nr:hypothetical protein [Methylobacterium sp. J-070]MCJ2051171.1 hypothetical protein [Methylobacterium sp. J-070]
MRNLMHSVLDGAFHLADALDGWLSEIVSGFGAAAPFAADSGTATSAEDPGARSID